jgi:nuclear transport factor 2 (NTF2) superfamily protein
MAIVRVKYLDDTLKEFKFVTLKNHNEHEYVYMTRLYTIRIPRIHVKFIEEYDD